MTRCEHLQANPTDVKFWHQIEDENWIYFHESDKKNKISGFVLARIEGMLRMLTFMLSNHSKYIMISQHVKKII